MGDCEYLHGGQLNEPVNALSSLAYIAAGAYVYRHGRRLEGAALAATGAGSFVYHAFGGSAAHLLHDGSIVVLAAMIVGALPRFWRAVRSRPMIAVLPLGLFAFALPLQLFGRSGGAWCQEASLLQPHAGWHILTAAAIATFFVLPRDSVGAPMRRHIRV